MQNLKRNYPFWSFLSDNQKDLILQGEFLRDKVVKQGKYRFSDYSFMVFPFAKAYEGFLKKVFLDVGFISDADYISTNFRLGKVLSPNLTAKLGEVSVYRKMVDKAGPGLADKVWHTWKIGRNEIFHYFPHNLRSVSLQEAEAIIGQITAAMAAVVTDLT